MSKVSVFGLLSVCILLSARESHQDPNTKRLLHHLLDKYNTLERPVKNDRDTLTVSLSVSLMQISSVDPYSEVLTTNLWLAFKWNDTNLEWDADEFGNITELIIPPNRIWTPDILMYNSVDPDFDSKFRTNVLVKNNGGVSWIAPGIFRSSCKFDFTWFPFDSQKCELKFGSWVHDGLKINLALEDVSGDIGSYVRSGQWNLIEMPARRNTIYYACCAEPYVDVTFVIHMQRNPANYFTSLVIPSVAIVALAVLAFTLPPESGAKLTLGLFTLYMLHNQSKDLWANLATVTLTTPWLATMYCSFTFLVAASVVATIILLSLHYGHVQARKMVWWFRALILFHIPPFVAMEKFRVSHGEKRRNVKCSSVESLLQPDSNGINLVADGESTSQNSDTDAKGRESEMTLILKELQNINGRMQNDDCENEIKREWKYAARVLDRIFLIVFVLLGIIITVVGLACVNTA